MRLRLLLPRRGRRGSLRRLRRLAASAAVLACVVAGCGDDAPRTTGSTPTTGTTAASRTGAPPPAAPGPADAQRLPIGLTEANPALLWAPDARPAPPGFERAREVAGALRPSRVRVMLDWSGLQPDPDRPADLAAHRPGCLRDSPPCAGWAGLREQLEAVASRGGDGMAPEVVVVVFGVPDWAARRPGGCERGREAPRSRPITARGLRAYAALVRDVVGLARQTGAALRWWSPWNEPNHPAFVSPQRRICDPRARSRAPAAYARLARAARSALPDGVGLVLGELAGYDDPTTRTTGVGEFVAGLPDDVACARGAVWAVHQFVGPRGTANSRSGDATRTLREALDERPCTARAPIWVTETGAGARDPGRARSGTRAELRASCHGLARVLRRWDRDPRVDGVFQYTVREDPLHPVGLTDAAMTTTYPAARLLAAWGATRPGERAPGAAACGPSRPPGCVLAW